MKRAVLLVSFGASHDDSRRLTLDALAEDFKAEFPEAVICQAYTSVFIRKALAKRGIHIDSLTEALERLAEEGMEEVLVQPTYMTPGEEYEQKVLAVVPSYKDRFKRLIVGEPAFVREEDYAKNLLAICQSIFLPRGTDLVLLGHGSPHRHNPVYERLQREIDAQGLPIHVGVLESTDTPDFAMVLKRLQARRAQKVLLAPLLLTAGMHVERDLAGEDETSWKSRLTQAGFAVSTIVQGLGESPYFRAIYIDKARRLLG
ncbi:MAG: sirohydrochlorin cobaltochelatase [Mitsuokella sp.]|uniref:sirohydrochlorin cobaltochelatase n=1 Tax=Mitsuokella sp. TaxID=2049034 RepID=UPI003F0925A7